MARWQHLQSPKPRWWPQRTMLGFPSSAASAYQHSKHITHHELGERSLDGIRAFYADPSEIGWRPHPEPEVDSFCVNFQLTSSKARSAGRDSLRAYDLYLGTGELTLSRKLTFTGRSVATGKRETCSVSLGCDCPQYLAPLLQTHSQALLSESVKKAQKEPWIATEHFRWGFVDTLKTVLKEMLESKAASGTAAFVSERPDVDESDFWSLVTVNAQATAPFKDKQGFAIPDRFTATVRFTVQVAPEIENEEGKTKVAWEVV